MAAYLVAHRGRIGNLITDKFAVDLREAPSRLSVHLTIRQTRFFRLDSFATKNVIVHSQYVIAYVLFHRVDTSRV